MIKFVKENKELMILTFYLSVMIVLLILMARKNRQNRKKEQSSFYRDNFLFYPVDGFLNRYNRLGDLANLNYSQTPCKDCGPGGMFGPGWTIEKFEDHVRQLKIRAKELSGGLSDNELEQAITRAGGLAPYVIGRQTAVKRLEQATNNLKGVMNIPGVHGLGSMINGDIEIAVADDMAKQKAQQFIEQKKMEMPMIPGHGPGYMGYPVKIVKREMAVAQ